MGTKYVQSERVLEDFYRNLANEDFENIHIPKSDVFYVRAAIEAQTGIRYTLDHVERAMYLEGFLSKHDVFDPDRPRPGID
jgi:hypothetical protein